MHELLNSQDNDKKKPQINSLSFSQYGRGVD